MTQFIEKMERCIMYISFQERRKREMECYRKERNTFQCMGKGELEYEYASLKSSYEHRKGVLMAFLVSILVSILMSFWKLFGECVGKIIQYLALYQGAEIEVAKVSLIVCAILIATLTVIIISLLVLYMRRLHQIYKRLLMVEEIRKELVVCQGARR